MSTRIIKTADGEVYSGYSSEFIEHGEYVEHHGHHHTTKIYKRAIMRDSISLQEGWSDLFPFLMILFILIVGIIIMIPSDMIDSGVQSAEENTPQEHVQPWIKPPRR